MKTILALALLSLASAVRVLPANHMYSNTNSHQTTQPPSTTTAAPTTTTPTTTLPRDDVIAQLSDGSAGAASGDNAVVAAANQNSGVAGAKGEDVAFGAAAPGGAFGFGGALAPVTAGATPSADLSSIFSIFN